MVSSGIFTTVGETVYRNGEFSKNTQELAPVLNTSDASLYMAVNLPHSITFGTLVNVQQKNSRPHAVVYFEESNFISDIRKEIFAFFKHCVDTLTSLEYTILPENDFLFFCSQESNFDISGSVDPEILQYTYGRFSVGKNTTCLSSDYHQTINYLAASIESMPSLLAADAVLAATRLGFGQADIIVSNSSDIQYQVNLDTMEIKSTESPEMYKQFAQVCEKMSAADVQNAVKEQVLYLYDKVEATNDDRKYRYYTFLQQERISTNLLAIRYALSTMEIKKKESKKGLISKISLGKDKSADKNKELRVKVGGSTLYPGIDYSYNPESNIVFINRKSMSGEAVVHPRRDMFMGNSGVERLPITEPRSVPVRPRMVRRDMGLPLTESPSFEQKSVTPVEDKKELSLEQKPEPVVVQEVSESEMISERTEAPAPPTAKPHFSLPKRLGVIGVGVTGLQCMKAVVETLQSGYPDVYSALELYSLSDDSGASPSISADMISLSSSLAIVSRDTGVTYYQNPSPAKMMSARSEMLTILASGRDLVAYSRKLRLIVSNSLKLNPKREIRVYIVSTEAENSDASLVFELNGMDAQIIQIQVESYDDCISPFIDAYLNSFPPALPADDSLGFIQR